MAIFQESTLQDEWPIWELVRHGPVTLFYKHQIIEETSDYLRLNGYLVYEFDCNNYGDKETILAAIASALGVIQDYDMSPNLNGFVDYMRDLVVPYEGGLALVFHHFDAFNRDNPQFAHHLLDILAEHYHQNLLFGRRFITLVHSTDSQLQLDPIGAFHAHWNAKEFLDKNRTS